MAEVPLIGITSYPRMVEIVPGSTVLQTASRYYVDGVLRAGAYPIVLPVAEAEHADGVIARLDGLLVPGGGDVDPARYGEDADPSVNTVDPARDAWEIACLQAALAIELPVLAICRGAQVLNVALGGSLVQDIVTAGGERHGWAARFGEGVHEVRLEAGCRLAGVLGTETVPANSLHHQAVDRPGKGVRAVGWAPDGTVEAIEIEGHPEVLAVQWHPELLEGDPLHQRLFDELVRAAREKSF